MKIMQSWKDSLGIFKKDNVNQLWLLLKKHGFGYNISWPIGAWFLMDLVIDNDSALSDALYLGLIIALFAATWSALLLYCSVYTTLTSDGNRVLRSGKFWGIAGIIFLIIFFVVFYGAATITSYLQPYLGANNTEIFFKQFSIVFFALLTCMFFYMRSNLSLYAFGKSFYNSILFVFSNLPGVLIVAVLLYGTFCIAFKLLTLFLSVIIDLLLNLFSATPDARARAHDSFFSIPYIMIMVWCATLYGYYFYKRVEEQADVYLD